MDGIGRKYEYYEDLVMSNARVFPRYTLAILVVRSDGSMDSTSKDPYNPILSVDSARLNKFLMKASRVRKVFFRVDFFMLLSRTSTYLFQSLLLLFINFLNKLTYYWS